mgnify:CR=1 FL=1
MPTNHTENYQLSQWERSDRILMEDFNADNAKIDAALKAEANARIALAAGVAKRGNCQIEIQTYAGTAEEGAYTTKRLTFFARPAFVFIMGQRDVRWLNGTSDCPLFLGGYKDVAYHLTLTPGTAHWEGNTAVIGPDDPRIAMNHKEQHYFVIAFIPVDTEITSIED